MGGGGNFTIFQRKPLNKKEFTLLSLEASNKKINFLKSLWGEKNGTRKSKWQVIYILFMFQSMLLIFGNSFSFLIIFYLGKHYLD